MARKSVKVSSAPSVSGPGISSLLGTAPVLPGESARLYRSGVLAAVQELGAQTPLQVYLAEKIFECLWWMRRYERQKHATVATEMASLIEPGERPLDLEKRSTVMDMIMADDINHALIAAMEGRNLSLDSLRQRALFACRGRLLALDEQIALKAKTLAGLQASFEVLVNRRLNTDRMRLQNELLRRDLGAVDVPLIGPPSDVKPTKKAG